MLARKLTAFDATLIVLGGIIGSGIFKNPSVVAQRVHSPGLILACWAVGGVIALAGAFVFAELAWRRPGVGGLYAYMRDAFHPAVAFCYGWTALLVSQSGGMALAAITFSAYVAPYTPFSVTLLSVLILAVFTAINCLGVREGGATQNVIMLAKLGAIAILVGFGIFTTPHAVALAHDAPALPLAPLLVAFAGALIPVMFAYDGWQTASFMSGELREPARSLPRGLIWGVAIVFVLYMLVNWVSLRVLGPGGLAATETPASDLMRYALGPAGERLIALFVAISTLGFLSNQVLTSPRIYYAMAVDGVFFSSVAWLHPRSRVPVVSIILQSAVAVAIMLLFRSNFGTILNYVTSMDFVFFSLAAVAVFVLRRAGDPSHALPKGICVPGHPYTTALFAIVCAAIVLNSYAAYPADTLIGLAILLSGVPVYYLWIAFAKKRAQAV